MIKYKIVDNKKDGNISWYHYTIEHPNEDLKAYLDGGKNKLSTQELENSILNFKTFNLEKDIEYIITCIFL